MEPEAGQWQDTIDPGYQRIIQPMIMQALWEKEVPKLNHPLIGGIVLYTRGRSFV